MRKMLGIGGKAKVEVRGGAVEEGRKKYIWKKLGMGRKAKVEVRGGEVEEKRRRGRRR